MHNLLQAVDWLKQKFVPTGLYVLARPLLAMDRWRNQFTTT